MQARDAGAVREIERLAVRRHRDAVDAGERVGPEESLHFAIAHAKASLAHAWMWYLGYDRSSARLANAKASADRALSLDTLGFDRPDSTCSL